VRVMEDVIKNTIEDLVSDFLYYDRKEDEDLPRGVIEGSIASGKLSVEDILKTFEAKLRKGLLD
jgi:hypothetical protein